MSLTQEDIQKANKWFAIECNNGAWELASKPDLTTEQKHELLLTAYASVYHWSKVGEPVNVARGEMLLAHVHAIRDEGDIAMRYANSIRSYYEANAGDPWEWGFVHLELGFAFAILGDKDSAADEFAKVRELIATMDKEDAEIVEDELKHVQTILA